MAKRELTLKDRLSRLSYTQVCKLLGENGSKLLMKGGKYDFALLSENVYLGDDLFRLNMTVNS